MAYNREENRKKIRTYFAELIQEQGYGVLEEAANNVEARRRKRGYNPDQHAPVCSQQPLISKSI